MTSRTTSRRWPREFEFSRTRENGDLGWRAARLRRCEGRRRQARRLPHRARRDQRARLRRDRPGPGRSAREVRLHGDGPGCAATRTMLQVTAAHEYNHVLQFAYDAAQDTWMFESTAVWMEDLVFDAVDHYLGFIPTWATLDEIPLARTFQDKHYGSGVWNMWLDARHGSGLIRSAWNGSRTTSPASFAPAAYDAALTAGGFDGFSPSFVSFVANVAEWRTGIGVPGGRRVRRRAAPREPPGRRRAGLAGARPHGLRALHDPAARGRVARGAAARRRAAGGRDRRARARRAHRRRSAGRHGHHDRRSSCPPAVRAPSSSRTPRPSVASPRCWSTRTPTRPRSRARTGSSPPTPSPSPPPPASAAASRRRPPTRPRRRCPAPRATAAS